MKQLHPGAKWLFRAMAYGTTLFLVFMSLWVLPIYKEIFLTDASWLMLAVIHLSIGIALAVTISEVYIRLSYNAWSYEFAEDGLKLERGIIWKGYSNIPYERVQNIDIRRGITARIFGFSSLYLQTAGYSGASHHSMEAEGLIPAIGMEEAEKLTTFVMKKISGKGK